jgi:hypothetical protein
MTTKLLSLISLFALVACGDAPGNPTETHQDQDTKHDSEPGDSQADTGAPTVGDGMATVADTGVPPVSDTGAPVPDAGTPDTVMATNDAGDANTSADTRGATSDTGPATVSCSGTTNQTGTFVAWTYTYDPVTMTACATVDTASLCVPCVLDTAGTDAGNVFQCAVAPKTLVARDIWSLGFNPGLDQVSLSASSDPKILEVPCN